MVGAGGAGNAGDIIFGDENGGNVVNPAMFDGARMRMREIIHGPWQIIRVQPVGRVLVGIVAGRDDGRIAWSAGSSRRTRFCVGGSITKDEDRSSGLFCMRRSKVVRNEVS